MTAPSHGVDQIEYPFASHFVQLAAGNMHYVDEGRGETILFSHGTPTWSFEWRHLVRALSATHRCIAPDHLGFGLSERPAFGVYTPEWHATNFEQFVERLNPGPLTLVVHDFGGPIALPIAISRPDVVRRLVVINSWMWSFAEDSDMQARARVAGSPLGRVLYRWANFSLRVIMPSAFGDRSKLTKAIHRQYLERFPDRWSRGTVLWQLAHSLLGSSAFYDSLWRQRDRLRDRSALVIWGMKDSAFRPHQLAKWREELPQAQVVELPDAGHWPHEEQPDVVAAALTRFLGAAR